MKIKTLQVESVVVLHDKKKRLINDYVSNIKQLSFMNNKFRQNSLNLQTH